MTSDLDDVRFRYMKLDEIIITCYLSVSVLRQAGRVGGERCHYWRNLPLKSHCRCLLTDERLGEEPPLQEEEII